MPILLRRRNLEPCCVALLSGFTMLIAVYFVLNGYKFKDLGADYYNQFNCERKINSHVRQLSKLGVSIPDKILLAAIAIRQ